MAEITLLVGSAPVVCSVERDGDQFDVRVSGVRHRLRLSPLEPGTFRLSDGSRSWTVPIARTPSRTFLHLDGCTLAYATAPGGDPTLGPRAELPTDLSAPMPGAVTQVLIGEHEQVVRGQPLVIVEAMKMEHVIRAPRAGRVRAVRARAGDQVEAGTVLVEIAWSPDEPAR